MARKTVIFTIDKRTTIARGYIQGDAGYVDMFMKTLTDAIEHEDADPENPSLTAEDKEDFNARENDDDDIITIENSNHVHVLDEFVKRDGE
jgi:hypothetical protein